MVIKYDDQMYKTLVYSITTSTLFSVDNGRDCLELERVSLANLFLLCLHF